MKQRKAVPHFVPVLWFITTLLWTITFCRNLSHNGTSGSLLLQAATVLVSLAAALVNLHRYRRDRNHTDW